MGAQPSGDSRPVARPLRWPFRVASRSGWSEQHATYRAASPALIERATDRALARPSGNWYVFGAADAIRTGRPTGVTVAGVELVAWRDATGTLIVGPGACPHLGASLATGVVSDGALICRWHGLRLTGEPRLGWRSLPAHDDGVLAWVRLDEVGGETPTELPVVPVRPPLAAGVAAVMIASGTCEPRDVIANRLDPWHGSWLHPYSFTRLEVVQTPSGRPDGDAAADRFLVQVSFRVAGNLVVPVTAEFVCPEPRTIVMRILEGEGTGSVVETHATPLAPGPDGRARTAVIEAVIAFSPRSGFGRARRVAPLLRPLMRRAAHRLWRDDIAYAERRYAVRTGGIRAAAEGR